MRDRKGPLPNERALTNLHIIDGRWFLAMATLYLPCGSIALVDDEDMDRVTLFKWHAYRQNHTTYVERRLALDRPKHRRGRIYLHRFILGVPATVRVDHRNGNGLDNQKHNLRPATAAQNSQNRRPLLNKASQFKGVFREKGRRWNAMIQVNGKLRWLGSFINEELAARAYDNAARIHFGEFAYLNFPSMGDVGAN